MMTSITGLPATPEALQLDMPLQVSFEPRGDYEPLGWTDDEVRVLFFQQLRRKLNDVGIGLSPDLEELLEKVQPVLAGG